MQNNPVLWVKAHESVTDVQKLLNKLMDEAKSELTKVMQDGVDKIKAGKSPEDKQDIHRAAVQLLSGASSKYQGAIAAITDVVRTFASSIETESVDRMQGLDDALEDQGATKE